MGIFYLFILSSISTSILAQSVAADIVNNQKSRIRDAWGSGQFGVSRDKNTRIHQGLDIIVREGEQIYAPFNGEIIRQATPYKNDPSYVGFVLKGTGKWNDYELKVFYVEGKLSGSVQTSQQIGVAQNISLKYPGITNHIHIEIKKNNTKVDPFEIWQMSF